MKKIMAIVLAAMLAAASFAGCGSSGSADTGSSAAAPSAAGDAAAAESGDTIKIGVLAPLTGEVSAYGIATSQGIQMGIDEINEAGGVLGKQIELIVLDEKGDSTEAVNAYNNLVDQGIVALLGDVTSKPCLAVAEIAAEDNMPMLTATGTAEDITLAGSNVFRTCFTDPFQGKIMATFAADNLGVKSAAVMYDTSGDYSMGLADAFKAQCAAKGVEVVAYEGYAAADIDFTTVLNKIVALNPDTIFVPDYYGDVSLILEQARNAGFEGPILGGDGWDGVLTAMPADKLPASNNGFYCSHYSADDAPAATALANYKEKFGIEGTSFTLLGYDSAYIMKDAIERAGSTDSQAIIDALAATDYEGVTGHITFDENGDPIKTVSVIEFVEGKATLKAKVDA